MLRPLLVIMVLAGSGITLKANANTDTALRQCLNGQLTQLEKTVHVGLSAENLATGKLLYSKNAAQSFLPASTIKLLTAVAALAYLPEDYQFKTVVRLAGQQRHARFTGNAYIEFSGDPSFKSSYLRRFVEKLKARGIKAFHGDVVIDRRQFATPDAAPGWLVDNVHICYAAPINALILDENCRRTAVHVQKNQVNVHAEFPFRFTNQVRISKDLSLPCRLEVKMQPKNNVLLYGCMYQDQAYGLALAVRDPVDYLEQGLKKAFAQEKIRWQGRVYEGSAPKTAHVMMRFHSQPLSLIVKDLLATSNNIEAEALLKKLGQLYYQQAGSFNNGVAAVKAILQNKLGLKTQDWQLYDGSGLSRYNQMSPEQFIQLLHALYQQPKLYKKIAVLLPRLGLDGRLVYYSVPKPLQGKIRGKTGSMQGVSNLVSIIHAGADNDIAVSLFLSAAVNQLKNYRQVQMNLLDCFIA